MHICNQLNRKKLINIIKHIILKFALKTSKLILNLFHNNIKTIVNLFFKYLLYILFYKNKTSLKKYSLISLLFNIFKYLRT